MKTVLLSLALPFFFPFIMNFCTSQNNPVEEPRSLGLFLLYPMLNFCAFILRSVIGPNSKPWKRQV